MFSKETEENLTEPGKLIASDLFSSGEKSYFYLILKRFYPFKIKWICDFRFRHMVFNQMKINQMLRTDLDVEFLSVSKPNKNVANEEIPTSKPLFRLTSRQKDGYFDHFIFHFPRFFRFVVTISIIKFNKYSFLFLYSGETSI